MHLPGEAMPSVQIRRLMLDQRSRRFSALLLGGEGKSRGSQITATGRYHRIVEIPVIVPSLKVMKFIFFEFLFKRISSLSLISAYGL